MEGNNQIERISGGAVDFGSPTVVTAAHELKSPLALMRQLALALQSGECSRRDAEKIADRIVLTSERALRLTTDLTKAARLEDSLFSLEPVNPVAIMEEVVSELSPLYQAKGRLLYVVPRQRSVLAVANRDLLRRIITNFADNALHYSLDSEAVALSVKAHSSGQGIRLSVRDYGPALPKNVWHTIASNLGTGRQSLHARPESSGLGMYVAGQFAQAMNGRLGAVRHRDGATFYVDLGASTQLRLL